jgi:Protein of unknown function (DUF2934)
MILANEVVSAAAARPTLLLRDSEEVPDQQHHHSLNEVQRRAYRVHQRHGGIYGGYTLEDWLEAEHELDEEDNSQAPQQDQIH